MNRSDERGFIGVLFFINLIVYWNLKPLIIMANFEIKFIDFLDQKDFIKCKKGEVKRLIDTDSVDVIYITSQVEGQEALIILDKSTAIKLAKTLRTEINKITEGEVGNG